MVDFVGHLEFLTITRLLSLTGGFEPIQEENQ